MDYIKYIILGLDIFTVLALVFLLLNGLANGFFKSLKKIICFLIPFIIFLFFVDTIVNVMLNFNISQYAATEFNTINEALINVFGEKIYGSSVNFENTEVYSLISALVFSVMRLVVYFLGLLVIWLIISPLCRIVFSIFKAFFGSSKGKKKKRRLLGLALGTVRCAIFLFVFTLPIYGMLTTASNVISSVENYEKEQVSSSQESELETVKNAINSSFVKQVFDIVKDKNGTSIQEKVLSKLLIIKLDDSKVEILSEVDSLKSLIPIVKKVVTTVDSNLVINTEELTDEEISLVSKYFKNSSLIKIALPAGIEYAAFVLKNKNINIENDILINTYNETENIQSLFATIIDSLKTIDLNIDNPLQMLYQDKSEEVINNIVKSLMNITIVKEEIIPYGIDFLKKQLINKVDEEILNNLLEKEKVLETLNNSTLDLAQLVKTVLKFKEETVNFTKLDFSTELALEIADSGVETFMNLPIIKNNLSYVLEAGLNLINQKLNIALSFDDVFNNLSSIDYSVEVSAIKESIEKFFLLVGSSKISIEILSSKDKVESLVNSLTQSTILKDLVVNIVEPFVKKINSKGDANLAAIISEIDFAAYKNISQSDFAAEICNLVFGVYDLSAIGLNVFEGNVSIDLIDISTDVLKTKFKSIVNTIFGLTLLKDNQNVILKLGIFFLNKVQMFSSLTYESVFGDLEAIDFNEEGNQLADTLLEVLKLHQEKKLTVDHLLANVSDFDKCINSIAKSKIAKNLIPVVLEKVVSSVAGTMLDDKLLAAFDFDSLKTLTETDFSTEVKKLVTSVNLISSLNSNIEVNTIKTLLSNILTLNILGTNQQVFIEYALSTFGLNTFLEDLGISLNYNVKDYSQEVTKINNVLDKINKICPLNEISLESIVALEKNSANAKLLADLFDAASASTLFTNFPKQALNAVIKNFTNIVLTDSDFEIIKKNTYNVEFATLFDIYTTANDLSNMTDLTSLNGTNVKAIMEKASKSHVASLFIGNVLYDILGENGLQIIIKSGGSYQYNFTTQASMISYKDTIASIIDLFISFTTFDSATASIEVITDKIADLKYSDLLQDTFNKILEETVDLKNVSFDKEASIINGVYQYHLDLQENPLTPIPAGLLEDYNNSIIAKKLVAKIGVSL